MATRCHQLKWQQAIGPLGPGPAAGMSPAPLPLTGDVSPCRTHGERVGTQGCSGTLRPSPSSGEQPPRWPWSPPHARPAHGTYFQNPGKNEDSFLNLCPIPLSGCPWPADLSERNKQSGTAPAPAARHPGPPEPPANNGTYLHPPCRAPRPPRPPLHPPGCEAAETGPPSRHRSAFYFSRRGGKRGAGSRASRFLWVPLAAPPPPRRPAPSPPGPGDSAGDPMSLRDGVGFLPHRAGLGAWHPHWHLPPTPTAVAPGPYLGARCGGYGRSRGCAKRLDHFMGQQGPAGGGARSGPPRATPTRGPPGGEVPWDAGWQPRGRLALEARGPSRRPRTALRQPSPHLPLVFVPCQQPVVLEAVQRFLEVR